MRTLVETKSRWESTFATNLNLSSLKTAVKDNTRNSPCNNGLRSICWKSFLLFENLDRSTWLKTLRDSRQAYISLRDHFLRDIHHPDDLSAADPLADDETSPWNTLRRDEILRAEIFQDVERCMPENLYFREPTTQSALLDILFIFCKLNADTGYRQGMHEILAPVLWVISRDAIDPRSLITPAESELEAYELFTEALDANFVEHDTFTLFCIVMQNAKAFYEVGSNGQHPGTGANNSPIVERSKRIHEEYLRRVDPELTDHLTTIEILPQIFVIRWIRLLFGREFPFEEVLCLWDILFAEDSSLCLVDLICVAMLLRIRWQLMEADYSSALTLLLRYPMPLSPHGPPSFVTDAIYLRGNLSAISGERLISRYSGKAPTSAIKNRGATSPYVLRFPGKRNHAIPAEQDNLSRSNSPMLSPAKFLQEQGGIEGILQEAARGVYSRGEKWGVGKALRGAVQGLQSGTSSPRRSLGGAPWSSDDGKTTANDSAHLDTRIRTLEERNKALARMLENAMSDLWVQQKAFDKEKSVAAADMLSLAIAKIQFVQVYLEDSTIPLLPETSTQVNDEQPKDSSPPILSLEGVPGDEKTKVAHSVIVVKPSNPDLAPIHSSSKSKEEAGISRATSPTPRLINEMPEETPSTTPSARAMKKSKPAKPQTGPSPFHHPRPSLAQSSFSWMLGEDKGKSSFVSASPFPDDKRRESIVRAKAGFLFGDEKNEGAGPGTSKGKEESEDDDGFTLGTLKGVPKGL